MNLKHFSSLMYRLQSKAKSTGTINFTPQPDVCESAEKVGEKAEI
jgi:hypothetical protein